MKTILYIAFLFSSLTVISQTENRKKPSLSEFKDSRHNWSSWELGKDNMYKSFQKYTDTVIEKDTLEYVEKYKKNKYWETYTVKYIGEREIVKKNGNVISYAEEIKHGKYSIYSEEGKIRREYKFQNGKIDSLYKSYKYYPDGSLKTVTILNEGKTWNIESYYYPNGSPYKDFGDFKDGIGTIYHLGQSGQPCPPYSTHPEKVQIIHIDEDCKRCK